MVSPQGVLSKILEHSSKDKWSKNQSINPCPHCGRLIGKHPAVSRRDNKTDVCSNCGTREALEDWEKHMEDKMNKKLGW